MKNRYRVLITLFVATGAMAVLLANTAPDEPSATVTPPDHAPLSAQSSPQNSSQNMPIKTEDAVAPPAPVITDPPMARDQMLYENHCTTCHSSQAYIRQQRKARSLVDIRHWVQRWATQLELNWSATEVELVSQYLNRNFYHFDSDEESRNEK
jgi:cytochrome c5